MSDSRTAVIADDHPLIRSGLRAVLKDAPDITIIGECGDGDSVRTLCTQLAPDLLLLDPVMPGPPVVDTIHFLQRRCPDTSVLIVSAEHRSDFVRSVIRAGVAGFLLKSDPLTCLLEAVRTVGEGGIWFSRAILTEVARQQALDAALELTDRETQILGCLARGWGNHRIAEHFDLSEQTVRNYVSHIYDKLGVRSRSEAVIWALEHGFNGEAT
ncbi:MAG TPA: response regulator transcription factor [Trueperaceae bacterium]